MTYRKDFVLLAHSGLFAGMGMGAAGGSESPSPCCQGQPRVNLSMVTLSCDWFPSYVYKS